MRGDDWGTNRLAASGKSRDTRNDVALAGVAREPECHTKGALSGMSFVLGIDIGMSYTAAAIGRQGADGSMAFEPLELGTRKAAVPTIVYLGPDGSVVVGEPAERRAIEHPDHVVREFKRRIGDETPMIVGELSVTAEDIFAVLAQWVVERAEEHEGAAPEVIALSHPASWGDHRLGLVRAALAGVGLAGVELVSEPEAAGLHYLVREKVDAGQTLAVYDLGGGTFDVALLRKHEDETLRVIGPPTGIERLGGADFDQLIFEHVKTLARDAFDGVDERQADAALSLARIRRECTDAKEALSFDAETSVPVFLPGAQTRVRLVRSEFEQMIDELLRRTVETLRDAVTNAELDLDDLTTVLLIGGSSRIPAVTQLISSELGVPVAIDADPKASISLGAAVAAARLVEYDRDGDPVREPDSDAEHPQRIGAVPAGAPSAAGAALPAERMSIGLRATVLAGVAAALLALLIPITPLAMGNQEPEGDPGDTSREPSNGAPAGRYVTGAPASTDASGLPPSGSGADDDTPGSGPLRTTPDATSDIFRPAPAASGSSGAAPSASSESPAAAPEDSSPSDPSSPSDSPSPTDPSPSPQPSPEPSPAPEPAPEPEPSPSPEPSPVVDPSPEPSPEPSPAPSPETSLEPSPEPEPAPDPVETPPSTP